MMRMFSGMGLAPGANQEDAFMPMMQNMMKTLLSKDVLYPSLKEISDKVGNGSDILNSRWFLVPV